MGGIGRGVECKRVDEPFAVELAQDNRAALGVVAEQRPVVVEIAIRQASLRWKARFVLSEQVTVLHGEAVAPTAGAATEPRHLIARPGSDEDVERLPVVAGRLSRGRSRDERGEGRDDYTHGSSCRVPTHAFSPGRLDQMTAWMDMDRRSA